MASSIARDALHVVLSFLDLPATATASAVCHFWDSATTSEPLKAAEGSVLPARDRLTADELEAILASRLSRHITSITAPPPPSHAREWCRPWVLCSPDVLALLHRLPRLAHLHAIIKEEGGKAFVPVADDVALPRTLASVRLMCEYSAGYLSGLVRSLVVSAAQLKEVHLAWCVSESYAVDLSSLQQLPHLTAFELDAYPSEKQVGVIRSLSSLRRLTLSNENSQLDSEPDNTYLMQQLFAPGHSLASLEMYDLSQGKWSLESLELLSTLPTLTAIQNDQDRGGEREDVLADTEVIAYLHRVPYLRYLALNLWGGAFPHVIEPSSFETHANLRVLKIFMLAIEEKQLAGFFASLPHLRTLELTNVTMASLTPLRSLLELEKLTITSTSSTCRDVHESYALCYPQCALTDDLEEHITVLAALPSLTWLTLHALGRTLVRTAALDQLRVPSERMPRLRYFATSPSCVNEHMAMALNHGHAPLNAISRHERNQKKKEAKLRKKQLTNQ